MQIFLNRLGILQFLFTLLVINLSFITHIIAQESSSGETVRLSPQLRIIPSSEHTKLKANLSQWQKDFLNVEVLQGSEITCLPRIISNKEGTILPYENDELYVSNLDRLDYKKPLGVYRLGRPIMAPGTKNVLGYPLKFIGDVKVKKVNIQDNLSLVTIKDIDGAVQPGDKILVKKDLKQVQLVRNTNPALTGKIVYLLDSVQIATMGQSVLINLGKKDGIKAGNRLALIEKRNVKRTIQLYEKDHFDKSDESNKKAVILPDENVGEILIYNTYDNLSLALITKNKNPVYLEQTIKSKSKSS